MNPGQDQDLFKSTGIFSSSSSLASISLTFLKHKQINQCCLQDKDIWRHIHKTWAPKEETAPSLSCTDLQGWSWIDLSSLDVWKKVFTLCHK